jgi:hypothetical protein
MSAHTAWYILSSYNLWVHVRHVLMYMGTFELRLSAGMLSFLLHDAYCMLHAACCLLL